MRHGQATADEPARDELGIGIKSHPSPYVARTTGFHFGSAVFSLAPTNDQTSSHWIRWQGSIRRLDEALEGFIWLVSRDTTAFPTIYPNSRVRIAEVGPLIGEDDELTNYMILFREEGENCVELLWIEQTP